MRIARCCGIFVLCLFALIVSSGCGSGPAAAPQPTPASVTLSASPATIAPNGSSTLTWSSTGATTVSIDQGVGPVAAAGNVVMKPIKTTTYTITATGAGGSATASATVTV